MPEGVETVVLKLEPSPTLSPIEPYQIGVPASAGAVIVDEALADVPPVRPLPDGSLQVSLPGDNGISYLLECSTNLKDWTQLADGVVVDGQIRFLDTPAVDVPQRFYRARLIEAAALPGDED